MLFWRKNSFFLSFQTPISCGIILEGLFLNIQTSRTTLKRFVTKIVASWPRAWSFSYFWKQRNSNQRSHNNASITWQKLLLFKIPNKKILETFFTYTRHDFSTSFHINVERKNCATAPKYQKFWNYREQSHGKPAFIGFVISKTPQIKSI